MAAGRPGRGIGKGPPLPLTGKAHMIGLGFPNPIRSICSTPFPPVTSSVGVRGQIAIRSFPHDLHHFSVVRAGGWCVGRDRHRGQRRHPGHTGSIRSQAFCDHHLAADAIPKNHAWLCSMPHGGLSAACVFLKCAGCFVLPRLQAPGAGSRITITSESFFSLLNRRMVEIGSEAAASITMV